MSAIENLRRKQRRNGAFVAALVAVGATVVILLAIAVWAALVLGLAWGIWTLVMEGPSFWGIAVIVACGVAILADLLRRGRK